MNDSVKAKVLAELDEKIFNERKGKSRSIEDLTYEKISYLPYFSNVFKEALRLEPPVIFSGVMKLIEPQIIDEVLICSSDNIVVSFHQLNHDPD